MKNHAFLLLENDEKERKLCTILRSRTNDALTNEHLKYIMQSMRPGCQYEVCVRTEPDIFRESLTLRHCERGKIVFGQALFGRNHGTEPCSGQSFSEQESAAVIITRFDGRSSEEIIRTLHIYVPHHLYTKGVGFHERQRQQTEACV